MAGFLSRVFGAGTRERTWIDTDELRQLLDRGGVLLIDVRQPEEYASPPGHLPGAINVPLGDLANRTAELAAQRKPIVLVCQTDRRSARAAAELRAAGRRDVMVLRGGTSAWHANGLPLE
jgi:rhodanese-related sulfurtransferase